MRETHGEQFWWVSLLSVFAFQGTVMLVVAAPIIFAAHQPVWYGVPVVAVGIAIEAVADAQLARFKANPDNASKVLDSGLWRYSRHPNYFGNASVWWGLFVLSGTWWTIFSPVLMTLLLLRVSGVAMLERTITDRRPAYADYIERTSAFIPLPPRRIRPE